MRKRGEAGNSACQATENRISPKRGTEMGVCRANNVLALLAQCKGCREKQDTREQR